MLQEAFKLNMVTLLSEWKWLLVLVSPFVFYILKFLLYVLVKALRKNIHNRLKNKQNTFIKYFSTMRFEHALSWIITCIPMSIFIENFDFSPKAEKYLFILLKVVFAINIIKIATMISDALCNLLTDMTQRKEYPLDQQIAPLISKSLKIFITIMGVLILLQNLGVDVTALIAGLGLGGVAIAFAAQNTVSNLFGTITILLDIPFKIGDRIKINNTEGVVETIGFRSTRLRTSSSTLVCIPNSIVASVQIDNLSEINATYQFKTVLGFEHQSSPEKLNRFTEEFSYYLKQDSRVIQRTVAVYFSDITDISKNITIVFQYALSDTDKESAAQENYFYQIEKVANQVGLKFYQSHFIPALTTV